jgi:methyl-accepting chemotaxis protein
MRLGRIRLRSMRTRLLLLVMSVALLVAVLSAAYSTVSGGRLLREQLVKRGTYIAGNLAHNARTAVLIDDRAQLLALIDGVRTVSGGSESDVAAVVIRDTQGEALAESGKRLGRLTVPAQAPPGVQVRDALTADGEEVLLFHSPILVTGAAEAAEMGMAAGTGSAEREGSLDVAVSKQVLSRRQRANLVNTVSMVGLAMLLGAAGGSYLTGRWVRPVKRMVEAAAAVAAGDLTRKVEVDSQDELATLGRSFNEMVDNLQRIVNEIRDASSQVASASGQISASSHSITRGAQIQAQAADETSSSMEEMAASVQAVARTAVNLASHVEQTSSSIAQMGASIEQVAESSATLAGTVAEASTTIEEMTVSIAQTAGNVQSLAATVTRTSSAVEEIATIVDAVAHDAAALGAAAQETHGTASELARTVSEVATLAREADGMSRQALDDARLGDEAVGQTIRGMGAISETMENTVRVIGGLDKRSREIGKILEVIEEIADQTNLLALNAAIEAARAGESGRGFAVVADEVRKLAERSVTATKEIGELVRQVQEETAEAVEASRAGARQTREGIGLADRAGTALRRIMGSVSRTREVMEGIAASSGRQSEASTRLLATANRMTDTTGQVTSAVGEQASRSRQVRMAVEEISRLMAEVATSTREQAAGGRAVRAAVENMNRFATEVGQATREQAQGSRQIVAAVESMNRMTQDVSRATSEQHRAGDLVVKAVENISRTAQDNVVAVEEMSRAITSLAGQAEGLARLVTVFQVEHVRPPGSSSRPTSSPPRSAGLTALDLARLPPEGTRPS